ncbi:MAG TPA: DUF2267 domain-containing protein [Geminicoccaceae bacterium]|nr:DUF2267 domain-containing protein [Geminicoccaceae bacterium]
MQINGAAGTMAYARSMNTGIEAFDRTLQLARPWLKDLTARLSTEDRHRAIWRCTRCAIGSRWTRRSIREGQLPLLARGFYDEGRRPGRSRLEGGVPGAYQGRVPLLGFEPGPAARAVFGLLAERVTAGEIEDVKGMWPEPIRELWPA